jgi:2-oxoglutarate ferredoxin oxidoreductase subunit alpha
MNPAALKVNLSRVKTGGTIIVNVDSFEQRNFDLARMSSNPLEDGSLESYKVIPVKLTTLSREALKDFDLNQKEVDRSKNMFALGLSLWLYSRPIQPAMDWLNMKFGSKPDILKANLQLLNKGFHYGETTEEFVVRYEVSPAKLKAGKYRAVRGVEAMTFGFVAAAARSGLTIFYGSYPITPASDLLHALSRHKNFGIITFQAEDEIAAVGAAIGASFGGSIGVTGTSGPGLALKGEAIGLAVMTELPLVVVDVQRGGPSTGLPTKTEQSDLLQAYYGRNGEAPLPIIAASTPGDCFETAYEACRIAVNYMTPVIFLSDGYLANGSEPWPIPDPSLLKEFDSSFAEGTNGTIDGEDVFLPYLRNEKTLSRPWAKPGTPDLEHRIGGLEKEHETGNVSYDSKNHEFMTKLREAKVERVQQEIPPLEVYGDQEGDLLVLGWGSTLGAIEAAVDVARSKGLSVGSTHLRWVRPLPADLGDVVSRFKQVLVPELNNGQLVRILRDKYLLPFQSYTKIQGSPFRSSELVAKIEELIGE